MKKIILSGVVLVLLIMIAIDIYNDHNRANEKNKAQVAAAIPGSSVVTPIATPLPATNGLGNSNDNATNTMDGPQSRIAANSRHNARRIKHITPVNGDLALADAPSHVADIDDESDGPDIPDIGAEVSKGFYGYIPNTSEGPEKEQAVVKTELPVGAGRRSIVHFGPEVSIMQNSLSDEHSQNMPRLGFRAGAIADIGLSEHIALQPGLLYELKGVEVENDNSTATMDVDTKDKLNLNYLEVPVDLVVKFGDWHDARFMVGAGPYIAYLLRAQDHYQTTTTIYNTTPSQNPAARTTENNPAGELGSSPVTNTGQYSLIGNNTTPGNTSMRTLDWGINGFVGCEMPGGLFAKAGTEVGLMDIQHNAGGSYTNRNYNFFVSVGYLIGYKK